jgi:hypothetical protein
MDWTTGVRSPAAAKDQQIAVLDNRYILFEVESTFLNTRMSFGVKGLSQGHDTVTTTVSFLPLTSK